jgi:hypothetical protein
MPDTGAHTPPPDSPLHGRDAADELETEAAQSDDEREPDQEHAPPSEPPLGPHREEDRRS